MDVFMSTQGHRGVGTVKLKVMLSFTYFTVSYVFLSRYYPVDFNVLIVIIIYSNPYQADPLLITVKILMTLTCF